MFNRSMRKAKMTAKARKAVELIAYQLGCSEDDIRKDRQAVAQMYEGLEELGYCWVSDKQEWAIVEELRKPKTLKMLIAVDTVQVEDARYLVEQAFPLAGFEILGVDTESNEMDYGNTTLIAVEVKL